MGMKILKEKKEKHNSQRRPEDAVPTLKGGASRYRNLKLIMKGVKRSVETLSVTLNWSQTIRAH